MESISKKHFHLGGITPSEWTHSIRTVRDSLVADYSSPGVNTRHHVAYLPPIAVSPILLALLVSYFKRTLCRCGQLWPYVRMGILGMSLHYDCNAIGNAVKIYPPVPSTCVRSAILSLLIIHIIPSYQIDVAIDNPSLLPSNSCLTSSS